MKNRPMFANRPFSQREPKLGSLREPARRQAYGDGPVLRHVKCRCGEFYEQNKPSPQR